MKAVVPCLLVLMLASCKKENTEAPDTEAPVVTITTPVNNQQFSGGQTVTVNATVADNKKLGEVHLEVLNLTSGGSLIHDHYTPATLSYALVKTFTVQSSNGYKIKVEAEDGSGNITRSDVTILTN